MTDTKQPDSSVSNSTPLENTISPGSDAAIKKGCICPVLDNNHGKGRGDGLFYIEPFCKLHGVDS